MCARERGWWKRDQEMEDFKHLILQPHFLFHWLSFLIKVIHPLDLKRQTVLQDLLWKTAMPPSPCPFPATNLLSPEAKIFFRISYLYKPTLVFPVL